MQAAGCNVTQEGEGRGKAVPLQGGVDRHDLRLRADLPDGSIAGEQLIAKRVLRRRNGFREQPQAIPNKLFLWLSVSQAVRCAGASETGCT